MKKDQLSYRVEASGVVIQLIKQGKELLRLFGGKRRAFDALPVDLQSVAFALASARALCADDERRVRIAPEHVFLSHDVVARLGSEEAAALGLPKLADLTFHAETRGVLGAPGFRMVARWTRRGVDTPTERIGAILKTTEGDRRLSYPAYLAMQAADGFSADRPLADHWTALARFRHSLDPEVGDEDAADDFAARVDMGEFLRSIRIDVADAMSLSPSPDRDDFDVVPFARDKLGDAPTEADALLDGTALATFQRRIRESGATVAYRVGERHFLAVDRSAAPALRVMAAKQRAPRAERIAFLNDPRPAIAEAVEAALRADGRFVGLGDAEAEAELEAELDPLIVETKEWAERVIGVARWEQPVLPIRPSSGTTWLPETFADAVAEALEQADTPTLVDLRDRVSAAAKAGESNVNWQGHQIPANDAVRSALDERIASRDGAAPDGDAKDDAGVPRDNGASDDRHVLQVKENFDDVAWLPDGPPRDPSPPAADAPASVRTTLMAHQRDSLAWLISAWAAGLPGVLNADEQGLGKTLQTLAFLAWRRARALTADATSTLRLPTLIVAPTSLLQNWEAEIARHLDEDGLGNLIRLYGGEVAKRKRLEARGVDLDDGQPRLDLAGLEEAVAEGRGVNQWVLTTYTTLANYHISLGSIPFGVAVFDEIQFLKNPAALRAAAAKAIKADFRIGLTGTPIENRSEDLWAIMDQLAPGALGSLRDFAGRYAEPSEDSMRELHRRVFKPAGSERTALGLRRLKSEVARDLPVKSRVIHARIMPREQQIAYDVARDKLARGGRGGALKALQHIRSISVHAGGSTGDDSFFTASARMTGAMQTLEWIKKRNERALVFIEHRNIQHRFAELVRMRFGLPRVDVINGNTPIPKRMATVDRFQRHLVRDEGFDVLILGPRAAGTGLTLTAATHVLHLSRWWNPAVEEQCNDRAHRIGQKHAVLVHLPLAIHPELEAGSFDCLLHSLMQRKRALATSVLWPEGDTQDDVAKLFEGIVSGEKRNGRHETLDVGGLLEALGDKAEHEVIDAHTVRVRPRGGGAATILSIGVMPSESILRSDDAEIVVLAGGAIQEDFGGVPCASLGKLGAGLWPDFIVA